MTYADSTPVNDACVSTGVDSSCVATTTSGKFDLWFLGKKYDTITLYVRKVDLLSGRTLRGKVTATVTGPTLSLGNVTLR